MNVKKKPTIKEISRAILELNNRTNTLHTMLLDLEKAFSLYVDMEKKNEKFSKYIDKKVKEWKKENDAKNYINIIAKRYLTDFGGERLSL